MSIAAFFSSGDVAFVILAVMAVEAVVLWRRLKRVPVFAAGLAAGACLVLALRSALMQHDWRFIALFLALSFLFHLVEIRQCLRLAKRQPN